MRRRLSRICFLSGNAGTRRQHRQERGFIGIRSVRRSQIWICGDFAADARREAAPGAVSQARWISVDKWISGEVEKWRSGEVRPGHWPMTGAQSTRPRSPAPSACRILLPRPVAERVAAVLRLTARTCTRWPPRRRGRQAVDLVDQIVSDEIRLHLLLEKRSALDTPAGTSLSAHIGSDSNDSACRRLNYTRPAWKAIVVDIGECGPPQSRCV